MENFNWIAFIIGLLSGMFIMFIITRILEFIRVILVSKYYKGIGRKGEVPSAEDIEKLKKTFGPSPGEGKGPGPG